ncbi:MAG: hypothetical protein QM761_07580 [Pseudoxanthomonas sp.]
MIDTTFLFARALGWSPQQLRERFRPATVEDLPALLAFRKRRDWDDAAYLRWRYGLQEEGGARYGQLWLLRSESQVLAAIGRETQPIQHAGRIHDGQLLMDVQVLPELEGRGGGMWLFQAMFERAQTTLAVGANRQSIGLAQRLFTPLPTRSYCVLPLDSAAMLRQKGYGPWARMGAPVLDAAWALAHRHAQRRKLAGIEVVETGDVSAAWLDALRSALPADTACVLPSAEHLHWRLFDNPRARYRLLVAHRDGRCIGYLALRNLAGDRGRITGLHLLDWKVAEDAAADTLTALLQAAIALARAERCDKVFTTVLDASAMPVLRRLGFLIRNSPMQVCGVRGEPSLLGLGGEGQWQITDLSYDSDGGY